MTTIQTPIADQIAEEHRLLNELGFTPAQAKTIIVARTIQAGNESKQITPAVSAEPKPEVYAIDEDGDRWEPVPHTDLWRCVTELDLSNRTSEDLERVYGPIEYHGLDGCRASVASRSSASSAGRAWSSSPSTCPAPSAPA
ncbi:hypothetical protein QDW34_gp59 [Microbacterium phage Burritobowl]|uniref:hypothetical protein n=1 Tax=Microbacterium phage Burritobowl TaxID=2762415 RepID=UPI0018614FED|nr:hypothetical protein QDW34_gp59 [Microbacterium phage Burritobowl]QNJ56217.1 hypothetical protein SEA_BURRITOBOWL_59 [Microbacterium phage Burritobowl]